MKLNLPTKLTMLRIILIPVFVALYFVPFSYHQVAATGVFGLACFTDFLDGHIARKYNLVTNLGKFLDPIADKMLVACALIAVCVTEPSANPVLPLFICVVVFSMIILSRELMVSGFRIVAADKGVVLAADKIGKFKTVAQMIALVLLLFVSDIVGVAETVAEIVYYAGFAFLALATILTIISGVHYIVGNKGVLED